MKFDSLVTMADKVMMYKYVIKNVATKYGKTVTFMPKPLFGDNGSGMHTHFSIWKGETPLFAGNGYAGLSDMALYAIGGLLKHAPAILAFSCPTTNSYKRLVPGFEAPVNLAYSQRNRSAAIRIPMYSPSPKAKRLEFRCPDPSCNPYLSFSAILMAGIDGIQNKIDPGEPLDKDIYDLSPEELKQRSAGAGLAGGGAGRPGGRPRLPAPRRRLHPGRDRDLDPVQDDQRGAGDAVAPASLRVLPVLRHLSRQGTRGWGLGAGTPRPWAASHGKRSGHRLFLRPVRNRKRAVLPGSHSPAGPWPGPALGLRKNC